jgi:endonuclease/exonuclease/phosphatase family metal-dependent hydrolase
MRKVVGIGALGIIAVAVAGAWYYAQTVSPVQPAHSTKTPPLVEPSHAPIDSAVPPAPVAAIAVEICSFNIQFLGSAKTRDNKALAEIVKNYDAVMIQELVAPPCDGVYPDGSAYNADSEAAAFFDEMHLRGFDFWLSEEDTGTGEKNHSAGTATEWWVVFYKPSRLERADDLPHGFLAEDRSNHPDFERVPYAFSLRTRDRHLDFVLISVHLMPDSGPASRARRKHELATISSWVVGHESAEKDFIILGDMNIENAAELVDATPPGFLSLNDECRPTNTNVRGPKPYDHVMYRRMFAKKMDETFDLKVVKLVDAMKPFWQGPGVYPGEPYEHDRFRAVYSDHDPVVFRLNVPEADDD